MPQKRGFSRKAGYEIGAKKNLTGSNGEEKNGENNQGRERGRECHMCKRGGTRWIRHGGGVKKGRQPFLPGEKTRFVFRPKKKKNSSKGARQGLGQERNSGRCENAKNRERQGKESAKKQQIVVAPKREVQGVSFKKKVLGNGRIKRREKKGLKRKGGEPSGEVGIYGAWGAHLLMLMELGGWET